MCVCAFVPVRPEGVLELVFGVGAFAPACPEGVGGGGRGQAVGARMHAHPGTAPAARVMLAALRCAALRRAAPRGASVECRAGVLRAAGASPWPGACGGRLSRGKSQWRDGGSHASFGRVRVVLAAGDALSLGHRAGGRPEGGAPGASTLRTAQATHPAAAVVRKIA